MQNEQLKIFVEEAHKEMFKTSKNAQGYTALARSKMFDFYADLENLPRIQRVLKSEQAISNRVKNLLGKDGIASEYLGNTRLFSFSSVCSFFNILFFYLHRNFCRLCTC
jgi:hypothetical protein